MPCLLLYIWTSKSPALNLTGAELCVQGWVSILDYLLLESDRADYLIYAFVKGRLRFLFAFEFYIYWCVCTCANVTAHIWTSEDNR